MTEREEILTGGNMTAVVRVGDTVRRAAGPWTPTIHAFLRHLRANGFALVPEPLGMDERGREILSLLPGATATYPLPEFAWSDETLTAVARTLRAFHDASVGFEGTRWQWPAHAPEEVICHNDFAPYNLMFEDGRLTGVIDLDLASPGPRGLDLAYTAYRFVPLTDPANPDAPFPGARVQRRRLELLCAAYGGQEPGEIAEYAVAKLREMVAFIRREAAAGDPAQRAVLERGDVAIYERDIAYLDEFSRDLRSTGQTATPQEAQVSKTRTRVAKVNTVIIPVAKQDEAIAFYVETLGLEKRVDVPFADDQYRWVEVAPEGADTTIAICPPGPGTTAGNKDTGISLQVGDVDAYHAELKEAGVDVDAEVSRFGDPVPPMFWFRDPEGNSLLVVEGVTS
jgi:catechol 2,3-dioxygenase-like lactoylglutathione lyase family enzyme